MSLFDRLLKQLDDRGLWVEPGAAADQLILKGPPAGKTPEIVRAVKAFKPQLLERFGHRPPPASPPESDPATAPEGESRPPAG